MTKDLKLAFMVAPFLAILGFVAVELWQSSFAQQAKVVELSIQGDCDITGRGCLLQSGDLQLSITDNAGITRINSTYPLDKVTFFIVSDDQLMTAYPLEMDNNRYYWQTATPLHKLLKAGTQQYPLPVISQSP